MVPSMKRRCAQAAPWRCHGRQPCRNRCSMPHWKATWAALSRRIRSHRRRSRRGRGGLAQGLVVDAGDDFGRDQDGDAQVQPHQPAHPAEHAIRPVPGQARHLLAIEEAPQVARVPLLFADEQAQRLHVGVVPAAGRITLGQPEEAFAIRALAELELPHRIRHRVPLPGGEPAGSSHGRSSNCSRLCAKCSRQRADVQTVMTAFLSAVAERRPAVGYGYMDTRAARAFDPAETPGGPPQLQADAGPRFLRRTNSARASSRRPTAWGRGTGR